MKISEIIELIERHIKIYREDFPNQKDAYERTYFDGAIEALTVLRNEFAMELKNES